jgi:hypothetical protein
MVDQKGKTTQSRRVTGRIPVTPATLERVRDFVAGLGNGATYDDALNYLMDRLGTSKQPMILGLEHREAFKDQKGEE